MARYFLSFLPCRAGGALPEDRNQPDVGPRVLESLLEIIPPEAQRAYDKVSWQNAAGTGQLPGHGPTDFRPWLAALRGTGYGGYVNPFMHGALEPDAMASALGRARQYLRHL